MEDLENKERDRNIDRLEMRISCTVVVVLRILSAWISLSLIQGHVFATDT